MIDASSTTIKGYELHEKLGSGGYGTVFRARQLLVNRDVAVKRIHPIYANHPDFIRRFEAEAQLVARIEHPHIVPLYDYWRDADGAFLVMRLLRGGNLRDLLKRGPRPINSVLLLLEQLASALTAAHRRGVVHRDLKPDNLLLDDDGNLYLGDFGIAKDLADPATYHARTQVIGSPDYLSPEQIEHRPITPQTDLYGLGVLLYELLTGQVPFPDLPLLALLTKHVNEPLPSLSTLRPDLPRSLDAVIQRATAKRPTDRQPDVLSLVRELRQALTWSRVVHEFPALAHDTSAPGAQAKGVPAGSDGARYATLPLDAGSLLVAAPPTDNPYKGLRAFGEADAADFFGRDTLIVRLRERLAETGEASRFLAVVGPSGSGKSSAVRAGLLPALRRGAIAGADRWFVIEMFPGADPVAELSTALRRVAIAPPPDLEQQIAADHDGLRSVVAQVLPGGPGSELLLVIDQFEELWTRVEREEQRRHLLHSIHAAVTAPDSRVRVIVTLRADFYDRPLLDTRFSQLMHRRTEVVVPLSADELRAAIVCPAERAGLHVGAGLVEAIVHDVGAQPGMLPLLQYALTELVDARSGQTLSLATYHASGGVAGALARRAEELFNALETGERAAAQQLFLRLVTPGDNVDDTRRRVRRSELAAAGGGPAALQRVIDRFCAFRLLTLDHDPATREPTVEIAHEALIRGWERLQLWLDTARHDLHLQRRLEAGALEWLASGKDPAFLATGTRLQQLNAWIDTTSVALNELEQRYLDASRVEHAAREAQEAARLAREAALERRSRRVLRALAAVSLAATVVALGLASYAWNRATAASAEFERANTSAREAQAAAARAAREEAAAIAAKANAERTAAEKQNLALSLGAQEALGKGNTELALGLAVIANEQAQRAPQAEVTLAEAAYAPGTRRVFRGHSAVVNDVALSPDGRTALSVAGDTSVRLWNLSTGRELRRFEGHTGPVTAVAWTPDGTRAVSASEDAMLIVWEIATGRALRRMQGHADIVNTVAVSPDGRMALSGAGRRQDPLDTSIKLWDLETGSLLAEWSGGHTQAVQHVAWSPDGTQALSGSRDTLVLRWDVATGRVTQTLTGHGRSVWSVAWSPDGTRALSSSEDTSIMLWDLATGTALDRLSGHSSDVWDVAWSPDGTLALSSSRDTRLGVWNLANGQLIHFLLGHSASVRSVAWSPDGNAALSASLDTTLRLWDLDSGAEAGRFVGHADAAKVTAWSPNGRILATGAGDTTVRLWDSATRSERSVLLGHGRGVYGLAWSPDGRTLLSSSEDHTLLLWDVERGTALHTFRGHTEGVSTVAWSPDGRWAISGSIDRTLRLWDLQERVAVRSFEGHTGDVYGVAWSPDGRYVLSSSADMTVIVWEVASGTLVRRLEGHTAAVRGVAWSADGRHALTGGQDNLLLLWDVATGTVLRRFAGHTGGVRDVAFSPDGTLAASSSSDGTVIVWDAQAGQALRRFTGHMAIVRDVSWSPDGNTVVSASDDGTVRAWRLDRNVAELLSWSRANRYLPELTCEQELLYGIAPSPACSDAVPRP